jgi:hypothetical protein
MHPENNLHVAAERAHALKRRPDMSAQKRKLAVGGDQPQQREVERGPRRS